MSINNIVSRYKQGLIKFRKNITENIKLLFRNSKNKEIFLEKLEELLILSDVGVSATEDIINHFEEINFSEYKKNNFMYFKEQLKKMFTDILNNSSSTIDTLEIKKDKLNVMMIVGVNGSGKTSSAAKIACKFKNKNNILLVPADTFRSAAVEQLKIMANRAGVEIVNSKEGADPASVVHDGINAAKARNKNIVIIDTAGRLHTKINLMSELKKIKRVIKKEAEEHSLEILQTIDATMGQNVISQAKLFNESLGVTGIILTKMDGTAKGGIVIAIKKELDIPVKLITFGEKLNNLHYFENDKFVEALLD
ncbi:MAG: signal recognition particle-docking protein FtsY [Candidatus Caldatribacteriota bacterium]|nr:signal recognition particle-docking protein FtsY [Candidatus Caldatribacteriota bacterium]